MTETREKLLEAKYFLGRMIENQSVRDAFKYNLSAFLAASRSVTLTMQTEYDKVSGFKEWYAKKRDEMKNDPFMKLLKNKRNLTIHQRQVEFKGKISVVIDETIHISESVSITQVLQNGTVIEYGSTPSFPSSEVKHEPNAKIEWVWYFHDLPEKDILTLSKEHLEKLEKLIQECEFLYPFVDSYMK